MGSGVPRRDSLWYVSLDSNVESKTGQSKHACKRDVWLVGASAMVRLLEFEVFGLKAQKGDARLLALEAKQLMIAQDQPRFIQNLGPRAGELQHNWRWIDKVLEGTASILRRASG